VFEILPTTHEKSGFTAQHEPQANHGHYYHSHHQYLHREGLLVHLPPPLQLQHCTAAPFGWETCRQEDDLHSALVRLPCYQMAERAQISQGIEGNVHMHIFCASQAARFRVKRRTGRQQVYQRHLAMLQRIIRFC